ncbi:MAG: helix-turn-helix transcriptional regulator, partial [Nannocystaceae bacterium]
WNAIDVAPLRVGDRIDIGTVALKLERLDGMAKSGESAVPPARVLLSARELEIAELVGQGMTNAEIGRKLGISRRTVATHLENAYQRLDIHSRAALVQRISEG